MKLILYFLFIICAQNLTFGLLIEEPIGSPVGTASGIFDTQFLGARFEFATPVQVISVGGNFINTFGEYFAAFVPLNSFNDLPIGDPPNGIAFNNGEVLASTTFQRLCRCDFDRFNNSL